MKDWKGNEIKVGDMVSVIQVSARFYESGNATERLSPDQIRHTQHPREDGVWILLRRYIIKDGLSGTISDDGTNELPIAMIEMIKPQPFEILTIEGVSDSREEYYRKKL
jgi:hypothetical protein